MARRSGLEGCSIEPVASLPEENHKKSSAALETRSQGDSSPEPGLDRSEKV